MRRDGKEETMNKTCKECYYFEHGNAGRGKCRRYPPPTCDDDRSTIDEQPNVSTEDWCGEFKQQ